MKRLLLALLACLSIAAPASAQIGAFIPEAAGSFYFRGNSPWIPNLPAGFVVNRFATWPNDTPNIVPYSNYLGQPLQMMTIASNVDRSSSIGLVKVATTVDNSGCMCVPIYAVWAQFTPPGEGFNPYVGNHNNWLSAYFGFVYGDGRTTQILTQWDTGQGSLSMSINGSPWLAPLPNTYQWTGTNFPVEYAGSGVRYVSIDSPYVGAWSNFPQASTQFWGYFGSIQTTVWGWGYNPISVDNQIGTPDSFYLNYGTGGNWFPNGYLGYGILW